LKQFLYSLLFILSHFISNAQTLSVQLFKQDHVCEKGAAAVQILSGKQPITVSWSNGESNVFSVDQLIAGNFSVTVKDSAQKDTVISFKIAKIECPVTISNHFTPSGDNYNDTWSISNTSYYPKLELYVYNKWGQQVHFQRGIYIPWDGDTVADGTYYYVFYYNANDRGNYLKGDVTILR
jgi:adhesin/invasin